MTQLISVIVPIYNVAPYLTDCLQSLSAQTYTNFEALLIDDGSTDDSGRICDTWAAVDQRFRVYHRQNQGLSCSRNFGLAQAKGQYCLFLDSDDYLQITALAETRAQMSPQVDVVFYDRLNLTQTQLTPFYHHNYQGLYTPQAMITGLLTRAFNHYATAYLVKTALLRQQRISFPPQQNFEDVATTYKVILAANRIYYLARPLYIYRSRADSISGRMTPLSRQQLQRANLAFAQGIRRSYPNKPLIDQYLMQGCFYLTNKAHDAYMAGELKQAAFFEELKSYQFVLAILLRHYPMTKFRKYRLLSQLMVQRQYGLWRQLWLRVKFGVAHG